ncbi:MAG TPA: type II toxin-antitoxin system RelE/ParE family toxin [Allosphingosinicella sp.]|nr:type II toxin-antitoxin system RelE/ParE family toxin [Allosphingosinicella sp.]
MKAVLTEAARADLAEIARHIGKDSIPTARRFTAALRTRALAVGRNPRLYPFAAGLEDVGIRRRVYRDYLILYVESDRRVEIIRIVHGSRDLPHVMSAASPSLRP